GLTPEDVLALIGMGGVLFPSPPVVAKRKLVPPERDPALDTFEVEAVAHEATPGGLARMAEVGVDLAATVAMSPLDTAGRAHGLEARLRFARIHLTFSGQSAVLGGDVGGFGASMVGLTFDPAKEGFFFGWGLSYQQQKS